MKKALSVLTSIIFLFAAIYFIASLIQKVISYITSLNSDIAVAIIAAAATVIVSVISIILGKIYEVKYQVRQENRQKKVPIYEELVEFMQRTLAGDKLGVKPSEEELGKFFLEWQQKIMIWGSDSVLKGWINWRRFTTKNAGSTSTLFLYEELLLEIRRDLGHKNKKIEKGDVLSLFINDIDKHLPVSKLKEPKN